MPSQAWVPLAATEVALLLTIALARRALASRRPYLRAWTVSLALFTVGAAALWYGSAFGWSGASFRLYYLCGALLAVPWLALGQLLLQGGRTTRDVSVALVVGFSVVGAFVVGLSPLRHGGVTGGLDLPDGGRLYDVLPRALVGAGNAAGTLVVIAGVGIAVWRQRRAGAAGRSRAAGLALVLLGVLAAGAGGALTFLGDVGANATALLVGVVVLYLGIVQSGRIVRIGRHRSIGARRG